MSNCRVDAHVHIRSVEALSDAAAAGVTALRDAGTKRGAGLSVCQERDKSAFKACVSAGWALYKKGGYGSSFGVGVESRGEIVAEIHKLSRSGAGIIKAMASGIVSLRSPDSITPGGFTGDELAFIVEQAQCAGLGVMAHANGEQAIIGAARAGVRSVEHGFFMTKRALEAMAERGVFWTPTVGALARAAREGAASGEMKARIAGVIASHLEMIQYAHGIGVALAIGTDCVLPDPRYQEAYEAELLYFEQAGLSRDKVLAIACDDGARILNIGSSSK
jgi:imidazolonepropionase-like amidohydrolase